MNLFNYIENKLLHIELKQRIREIKEYNSEQIIRYRLMPHIIDTTLYKEGYLMTQKQALERAVNLFIEKKRRGEIDELNNMIRD